MIAPSAHAGWTAPLPVRSATPGALPLTSPAIALGSGSRGAILAERPLGDGTSVIAQGSVRRARVGAVADVLPGPATSYAVAPAGGAGVVVSTPEGPAGYYRDARAPFALLALGGLGVQTSVATNARGDAVFATASTTAAGVVAIVMRPAGAPASPAIVISEPGRLALRDLAIGDNGHVAVVWDRGGVLEARVAEPTGALSPVAPLTLPGMQVNEASIAVDGRGAADVAAVVATPPPAGSTVGGTAVAAARRPPGGAFSAIAVLDAGSSIESLDAVAAGDHGLVTWLLTNVAPAPADISVTRIHGASRRGDEPLRRVPIAAARGGEATVGNPRPAVAADGSAVIASGFGGAVHVAHRRAGRRGFPRPRVISTLSGGQQGFTRLNPTVAAAPGGRALVAWDNSGGLLRLTSLLPGARDRSGGPRSRPPSLRASPPLLDLNTIPATIRGIVACDGPCRVTVLLVVRGSSTERVRVEKVLSRGGRAVLAEQISAREERRVRRLRNPRSVTTTVTAANRYGALVRRVNIVR